MASRPDIYDPNSNMKRPSITFTLDQPIDFPGQPTLRELTVRPYTGWDLVESGMPFTFKRDPKGNTAEVSDPEACVALLARVCDISRGQVKSLSAVDFVQAVDALRGFFFYRTPPSSSTDTSPSDDGAETANLLSD